MLFVIGLSFLFTHYVDSGPMMSCGAGFLSRYSPSSNLIVLVFPDRSRPGLDQR